MGEGIIMSKESYLATATYSNYELDYFTEYISGGTLRQVLKDKVRKDSTCLVPTES